MSESILTSTKKALNITEAYEVFDPDIIMHINSVFDTLKQLGIGPAEGFMIEDKDTLWSAYLGASLRYNSIKTYIYLRVRMLFDPPTTGYHMEAMKEQIKELEWRLNVDREDTDWVDPDPDDVIPDEDDLVLDGGAP